MVGDESGGHSWQPVDLVTLGDQPPLLPTVGGLLYPGCRHIALGEPETLKSWFACVLSVIEIHAGRCAMYLDFEMGPGVTLERLRALGLQDTQIRDLFVYLQPSEPLGQDIAVLSEIQATLEERRPSLVTVDGLPGFMHLHGLDGDKRHDVESAYLISDRFRSAGAALLYLEHVVKNAEQRGRWAIGSERKIGVPEVALGIEVTQTFGRGRHGSARILVRKDRLGHLARPQAATLELRSDPDTGAVTHTLNLSSTELAHERHTAFRPTFLMERVSLYLEGQPEPVSRKTVEDGVKGQARAVRTAIDILVTEGHVDQTPGSRGAKLLRSLKPYRDTTSSHLVPPRPDLVPDEVEPPRPTSSTSSLKDEVEDEDEDATRNGHLVPTDELDARIAGWDLQ